MIASVAVLTLAIAAGIGIVLNTEAGAIADWATPLREREFWMMQLVQTSVFYGVAAVSGLLVRHWDVKVNYTRKINHFALFFVPIALRDVFALHRPPRRIS